MVRKVASTMHLDFPGYSCLPIVNFLGIVFSFDMTFQCRIGANLILCISEFQEIVGAVDSHQFSVLVIVCAAIMTWNLVVTATTERPHTVATGHRKRKP